MGATILEIRAFAPTDWGAVCDVYAPAAKLELTLSGTDPRAFRHLHDEEDLDTFRRLNSCRVAVIEGDEVRFVGWRDRGEWVSSGYLSHLYVDPAHVRRGIGEGLLTPAMDALGSEAWTLVRHGNDPAIRLYEKHGMEIVRSYPAEAWGYPYVELRMALPTSRKRDPEAPNFGS